MAYLSLAPVSIGVRAALNVGAMNLLVGTRIYEAVPQNPTFPFIFYEVREIRDLRGFGTGGLPEVELRVHAFSRIEAMSEAQSIIQKVIELLRDQAISVTGHTQAGRVFYDETVPLANEVINGVACRELVASFRIYVEEA